uniref:Uncharacterized protein n=1 Tax=Anguilla anguilla TaxID=7936 RepID=A0A0E9RK64_ANGAN
MLNLISTSNSPSISSLCLPSSREMCHFCRVNVTSHHKLSLSGAHTSVFLGLAITMQSEQYRKIILFSHSHCIVSHNATRMYSK